jgi:hypothetical protein
LKGWVKNPVDQFILAKLEERGLKPSPEADRETLLRRVSLDLTGLPPTPAERRSFLSDKSPNAYEKVVDRLLGSPRFGERMAMDWMDYARYADSNGYQADYERFQWRWRDWVIDAYNKNMPFDQFTVEQIAGDMLPNPSLNQLIATGFNRNHRINTEGGVIAEEWRVETVIDRVETVSTTWLGLSAGCARCHDHKYDPLSQKEFYAMFSYFNNVPETGSGEERPVNHPPFIDAPYPDQVAKLNSLSAKTASLESQLREKLIQNAAKAAAWTPGPEFGIPKTPAATEVRYAFGGNPAVAAGNGSKPDYKGQSKAGETRVTGSVEVGGDNFVDLGQAGNFSKDKAFSYSAWIKPKSLDGAVFGKMDVGNDYRGWDCWLQGGQPAIHIISKWPENALKMVSRTKIPANQWSHVVVTYDGSARPEGVRIYVNGNKTDIYAETNSLKGEIDTKVSLKIGRRTDDGRWSGSVDDLMLVRGVLDPAEIKLMANTGEAAGLLSIPAEKRTVAQREALTRLWSRENDPAFRSADDERVKLKLEYDRVKSEVPSLMVMKEMPKPRPAFVLLRGQYDKKGPEVKAGIPAVLPPLPKGAPNNRLGFAKWLVDKNNPLTPRVITNRFWERFFGQGLVPTSEDFGTRAEFPSHPELLDWLAVEFRDKGWNIKQTMKLLVMSATYRQSSKVTPLLLQKDPENKFYARGPRFRLPAEVLRDQALHTAGLLVNKIGGRSVRPYQPEGVWDELNVYGNLRNYKPDMGEGRYRRSLYTIWKRTAPPPNMTLFDAPGREMCRVRRSRTNTPLQALALMNDVTYFEAARALAERVMHEGGKDVPSRLSYAFELVLSRKPSKQELSILSKSIEKRIAQYKRSPKDAAALISFGDLKHDSKLDPAEFAAYSLAASTLMNLDETVTKE